MSGSHLFAEEFSTKPAEIKRLLRGELDVWRPRERAEERRAAGPLP